MVFDFDSLTDNRKPVLVVVERDPPVGNGTRYDGNRQPALAAEPATWQPELPVPAPWAYVSDSDPRDPIEMEFAQDANEAWEWVQNHVQLRMYKRITPMFVWLTWPAPSGTGVGQGHRTDHEVRKLTFGQMATKYGYDLHYHGQS